MHRSPKPKLPPWLLGLLFALVLVAVVLVIANLLGYGDDPAIGAVAAFPGLSYSGIGLPLQSTPSAGRYNAQNVSIATLPSEYVRCRSVST